MECANERVPNICRRMQKVDGKMTYIETNDSEKIINLKFWIIKK